MTTTIVMIFYYSSENVSLLLHKLWRLTVEHLPETITLTSGGFQQQQQQRQQKSIVKKKNNENKKMNILFIVGYDKKQWFEDLCLVSYQFILNFFFPVENDLNSFFSSCRLPLHRFSIKAWGRRRKQKKMNNLVTCITCKCWRSSIGEVYDKCFMLEYGKHNIQFKVLTYI